MKRLPLRTLMCALAILLAAALVLLTPPLFSRQMAPRLPRAADRTLLRVWVTSSIGGGQAWLKEQLKAWEKRNPGVMTYLRTVSPEEIAEEGAVLPDVILYMPGDFAAPEEIFSPLSGELNARESLLRAGKWRNQQYGLPLCYGAWVLAIDSAIEPGSAATPAPTTLLGRPAATDPAQATEEPGFPLEAASRAEVALQAPAGCGLFSLLSLLEERPALPDDFASLTAAEVYSGFLARKYASALLTTGQLTALTSLTASGSGFPFRVLAPREVITDQVWFGSVVEGASGEAASLLAYLTGTEAQRALTKQGLHTVREDLRLYAVGPEAQVETAAGRSLTAINAYIPATDVQAAAWQVFTGREDISGGLLPLL
ncbi:MAG: hypothetical protein J1E43_10575 [Christensenellaceae bacterium]|nr:hypothetical protein [Christensenellaceae bacterium]